MVRVGAGGGLGRTAPAATAAAVEATRGQAPCLVVVWGLVLAAVAWHCRHTVMCTRACLQNKPSASRFWGVVPAVSELCVCSYMTTRVRCMCVCECRYRHPVIRKFDLGPQAAREPETAVVWDYFLRFLRGDCSPGGLTATERVAVAGHKRPRALRWRWRCLMVPPSDARGVKCVR